MGEVWLDAQAAQNRAHFDRGIARYVCEQVRAVSELAPERVQAVALNASHPLMSNLDFVLGNEEGQLPIRKLRTTLMRLPRNLTGKDVNALDKRLGALMARPQMPKGAIPKSMRPSTACA